MPCLSEKFVGTPKNEIEFVEFEVEEFKAKERPQIEVENQDSIPTNVE